MAMEATLVDTGHRLVQELHPLLGRRQEQNGRGRPQPSGVVQVPVRPGQGAARVPGCPEVAVHGLEIGDHSVDGLGASAVSGRCRGRFGELVTQVMAAGQERGQDAEMSQREAAQVGVVGRQLLEDLLPQLLGHRGLPGEGQRHAELAGNLGR